jgi:hypothetical protein
MISDRLIACYSAQTLAIKRNFRCSRNKTHLSKLNHAKNEIMQNLNKIIISLAAFAFFILAFLYKGKIAGRVPWSAENLKVTFLYIVFIVPIFILIGYFIQKAKKNK